MSDNQQPMFVYIDPQTGLALPETFDSVSTRLRSALLTSVHLPPPIQETLSLAIDFFALAYDQANSGRPQLMNPLINQAFHYAVNALESALRDQLPPPPPRGLRYLLEAGKLQGLLPDDEPHNLLYRVLREDRNTIAHGAGEQHVAGFFQLWMIEVTIRLITHVCVPTP